jgi:hypothetical protein
MMRIVIATAFLAAAANAFSIGDRLVRTYTEYVPLPITAQDATSQGWKPYNTTCDPALGVPYTHGGAAPSKNAPMILYFTAQGQAAGVGVHDYGSAKSNLVSKGFWQQVGNSEYSISITFRNSSDMCSATPSQLPLGDQLIVNAAGLAYPLPVLESDASTQQWTRGSCFAGMGTHYFYDLASPGNPTWESANLLPISLMYNTTINAFFFMTTNVQVGISGAHGWEPVPLPNALMCKNWCSSECTFHDTSIFSTMHIYLHDHTTVTCPGGCTIACCPK